MKSACACLVALSASLLLGCAAPKMRLTEEERAQLGQIALAQGHEKPVAVFDGVPDAGEAAARGFLGGLLVPWAWVAGGPITMAPLMAARASACSAQFDGIEDPEGRFRNAVLALKPEELLLANLESAIVNVKAKAPSRLGAPLPRISDDRFNSSAIPGSSVDTVIQVEKFELRLSSTFTDSRSTGADACFPTISATAQIHVIRVKDGALMATVYGYWRTDKEGLLFRQLFDEVSQLEDSVKETLSKLAASAVCNSRLGPMRC